MRRRLPRGDAGFVGGAEGILFGVLACLVVALLGAAVWDAARGRVAATTAAREAARAYVEHAGTGDPVAAAEATARAVLVDRGRDPERVAVEVRTSSFARCQRVVVEVRYELPAVALPFGDGIGATTVSGRASELVDPYRDDVPGEAACA